MVKAMNITSAEGGYVVQVVFQDGVQELHVVGNVAKLAKLVKTAFTFKEEPQFEPEAR